jgi:Copper type II ascorbate-dependent monooxygenase, C-terminal domain
VEGSRPGANRSVKCTKSGTLRLDIPALGRLFLAEQPAPGLVKEAYISPQGALSMMRNQLLEGIRAPQLGLAAALSLLGASIVGCAEDEPTSTRGSSVTTPGGGGFLSGVAGGGGTTGAPAAPGGGTTNFFPATTAGAGVGIPVTPGGGTTGFPTTTGGGGTTGAAATAGGGGASNALWCKAKAVLDSRCSSCHNGMSTGPMPLLTAADFKRPAPVSAGKTVAEAVSARTHNAANPMPPRGMLAATELADLDAFIAAGAPAIEGACASTPPATGGGAAGGGEWPPAGCDQVVKLVSRGSGGANAPYVVQPRQEIHPQIILDAPWGNENVQAIAFRPITDNAKVLHHWILYANGGVGAFLTGWAPGDDDRNPFPPDVGMELPKGAQSLRLDMHYFSMNETTAQNDASGVEICIVKGANLRPKPAAITMSFVSIGLPLAPANAVNHESTGVCEVTADGPVTLMGSGPHAHKLATRTKFWIKKANGQEVLLLDHPFKFGEQGSYPLTPNVVIETGDTVYTSCFYTNPSNRDVNFGQNTSDEMCFNFALYYPKTANLSCGLGGLLGGLGGLLGGGSGAGGFIGGF